jgi:hypothetical protein
VVALLSGTAAPLAAVMGDGLRFYYHKTGPSIESVFKIVDVEVSLRVISFLSVSVLIHRRLDSIFSLIVCVCIIIDSVYFIHIYNTDCEYSGSHIYSPCLLHLLVL